MFQCSVLDEYFLAVKADDGSTISTLEAIVFNPPNSDIQSQNDLFIPSSAVAESENLNENPDHNTGIIIYFYLSMFLTPTSSIFKSTEVEIYLSGTERQGRAQFYRYSVLK